MVTSKHTRAIQQPNATWGPSLDPEDSNQLQTNKVHETMGTSEQTAYFNFRYDNGIGVDKGEKGPLSLEIMTRYSEMK